MLFCCPAQIKSQESRVTQRPKVVCHINHTPGHGLQYQRQRANIKEAQHFFLQESVHIWLDWVTCPYWGQCTEFISVLWHCCLGDRNGIRSVQTNATYYGRPADADIIFLPCGFFFFYLSFFFSSPNLSGRRLDVYHTSTHGVALGQLSLSSFRGR